MNIFRGSVFNGGVFFNPGHYTFCSYTTNADAQDGTIKLSLPADKKITIHWGDGNTTDITGAVSYVEYTNTYAVIGDYDITVTGDYNDISYLALLGDGSYSGDIKYFPNNLLDFRSAYENTFYGDLANTPNIIDYIIYGDNTVTGNVGSMSNDVVALFIIGHNTLFGDFAKTSVKLYKTRIYGNNTISSYSTSKVWADTQSRVDITPVSPGGLSTAEVDALLHDLAQVTTWTGSKVIVLTGTNEPRSSASDADVTTLTNLGVTVTTNT